MTIHTHTLTNKTSFTAAYPGHVVTLNETDVPEYNRKGIESGLRDHGKNIQWGDSISIDSKFGKTGRRVAIFADSITSNTDYHDKNDDPILQMLRQSGRWTEVLVAVKDGSETIYVAPLSIACQEQTTTKTSIERTKSSSPLP